MLIETEENYTPRNERLNAALHDAGLELADRSNGGRGGPGLLPESWDRSG